MECARVSSSLFTTPPEAAAEAWPPVPQHPLPLVAAQIALTIRPDWPGEPPDHASALQLADEVVAGLRLAPDTPIGIEAVLPAQGQFAWQRESDSLVPATGGFALADLLWFG